MRAFNRSPRGAGFTLVELLVVMVIILLVSAVTLPTVLPALQHQQVSEAARILQAELQRCRDLASRSGVPQGIRFLIDKPLAQSGRPVLAYSSFVNVEASPDYAEGKVSVSPTRGASGQIIAFGPTTDPSGGVLPPTGWYWNIRRGDQIRFNDSGPFYTIVGPFDTANADLNTEGFINEGPPGTMPSGVGGAELLWLTNGIDDNNNGYTDEPYDGLNPTVNDGETLIQAVRDYSTYVIKRRPAVNPRSRVISMPSDVVIDATDFAASPPMRSRYLPIDPQFPQFFDVIFSPNGKILKNTPFAGYSKLPTIPFYHFWLTERDGVVDLMSPMPVPPVLKGDRRLITLFTNSGLVVVKQVDDIVNPNDATDQNYPYRDAQAGIKDKL